VGGVFEGESDAAVELDRVSRGALSRRRGGGQRCSGREQRIAAVVVLDCR
jgi:hypothetical protein